MDKNKEELAREYFFQKKYDSAKKIFIELNLTYEAASCCLLMEDIASARGFFTIKQDICPASNFGIIITGILEDKPTHTAGYFQARSFLEVFLNLFIENKLFKYAQKVIDNYKFFINSNPEAAKFIARVLYANECFLAIHSFAKLAKEICFYDAEIHFIDASVYISENNNKEAMKCVKDCLSFAPEYYPVLKLKSELEGVN